MWKSIEFCIKLNICVSLLLFAGVTSVSVTPGLRGERVSDCAGSHVVTAAHHGSELCTELEIIIWLQHLHFNFVLFSPALCICFALPLHLAETRLL